MPICPISLNLLHLLVSNVLLELPSRHTFDQYFKKHCAYLNVPVRFCVCVCEKAFCEASTQQGDDKYSQPSAPHELMDRQPKNTGGLVAVPECARVCVCIVARRGKGGKRCMDSVCVCVCV